MRRDDEERPPDVGTGSGPDDSGTRPDGRGPDGGGLQLDGRGPHDSGVQPDGNAGRPGGADLTLDELAERSGVSPRTIRFYQSSGVLPRPRKVGVTPGTGRTTSTGSG